MFALGGVLVATGLDPTFSWSHDALSDLGVRPASALPFRLGLLLGGLLGTVYGIGIWKQGTTTPTKSVGILFAGSASSLAGVGVFVIGHPLHQPAAIGFFGLAMLAFATDGVSRETRSATVTLILLVALIGSWVTWAYGLWPGPGLALPEMIGAVIVATWMWCFSPLPAIVDPMDVANRESTEA